MGIDAEIESNTKGVPDSGEKVELASHNSLCSTIESPYRISHLPLRHTLLHDDDYCTAEGALLCSCEVVPQVPFITINTQTSKDDDD